MSNSVNLCEFIGVGIIL